MGLRQRAMETMRDLPPGVHEAVPPALRRSLRHRMGRYFAWEAGYDHHRTPELEPGEVGGAPDFVGIGVQKAGTTWWHALILAHPHVSDRQSIHKERHFFARFGAESFGPTDIADYQKWFPHQPGTITGEWTPDYFNYPWVPPLLVQAAPDARLLLLLRDPIERFRSGIAHQMRNGAEHMGTVQAEALSMSRYADGIRRWRAVVPEDRLLVLQYEACVADPSTALGTTYAFLGLDADYRPPILHEEVNKTVEAKPQLPADVAARLKDLLSTDVAEVAALLPEFDMSLWPSAD